MRLHDLPLETYLHVVKSIHEHSLHNSFGLEDRDLLLRLYDEELCKYISSFYDRCSFLKDAVDNVEVKLGVLAENLVVDYLNRKNDGVFLSRWGDWNHLSCLDNYLVGQSKFFIRKSKVTGLFENNFDLNSNRQVLKDLSPFFGLSGKFDYGKLNSLVSSARGIDYYVDRTRDLVLRSV